MHQGKNTKEERKQSATTRLILTNIIAKPPYQGNATQFYTRMQISAKLGGNPYGGTVQNNNSDVQPVHYTLTPEWNPYAPDSVIVGEQVGRIQSTLETDSPVPIFLRKAQNCWGYEGCFEIDPDRKKEVVDPSTASVFSSQLLTFVSCRQLSYKTTGNMIDSSYLSYI